MNTRMWVDEEGGVGGERESAREEEAKVKRMNRQHWIE